MIRQKHDLKKLSSIDKNKLAILVEKYGAEQLLNEGFDKKKLAALIGAGIITGSSLMDLPKNYTNKEDTRIEYNNPYGINNIDYKNILNKEKLVKEYISNILSKHGKTLSDLRFNPDNLVLASYQYDYDLPLLLAQLQMESHFGTTKRAQRTNSMFSIGAYDDGRDVVKYADQDSSIIPFIKIIKREIIIDNNILFRENTAYEDTPCLVFVCTQPPRCSMIHCLTKCRGEVGRLDGCRQAVYLFEVFFSKPN